MQHCGADLQAAKQPALRTKTKQPSCWLPFCTTIFFTIIIITLKRKPNRVILLVLVLRTIKKYLIKFLNQYYNHLVHNHAHLTVNLTRLVSHTTNTIYKKQLLGIVSDALKYVNFQSKMTCAVNFNALESLYFLSFWSTNFACLKSCDSS